MAALARAWLGLAGLVRLTGCRSACRWRVIDSLAGSASACRDAARVCERLLSPWRPQVHPNSARGDPLTTPTAPEGGAPRGSHTPEDTDRRRPRGARCGAVRCG